MDFSSNRTWRNEDASETRLRDCGSRECVGIILVLAREQHWCSTSVLSPWAQRILHLIAGILFGALAIFARAETGRTVVITTISGVLSVIPS